MGSCSTRIKLSEDDKHTLELSIDDKLNFTSNLILCSSKTTSKKDKLYLESIAYRYLVR